MADIYVHVHDIQLPKGLDTQNAIQKHMNWTEQHLLAAYMLDNPKTTFMLGSVFLKEFHPDLIAELMQDKPKTRGVSFWFSLSGAL